MAAAGAIEVLTIIDKKLFSEAVYPTLANADPKSSAFKAKKTVEIDGYVSYSMATHTALELASFHWFTLTTLSELEGITTKKLLSCSEVKPLGMIETLTAMKTVLDLLKTAF